ncbi:phragmoplastin interacting protein 1-like [Pyrus communis]|uniref:phragmoplastin interacting protein 1-like n=1 Tax=Pyrus communis TaxID=23211 RepID=UPI0035BEB773
MVLSNRKLKQKLREKLAQSIVESVGKPKTDPTNDGSENPDPKSTPRSLKVLLDSATQKPRLSKREKRRKILSLRGPEVVSVNGSGGNLRGNKGEERKSDMGSDEEEEDEKKKKKKKRKRDEGEQDGDLSAEENGVGKKESKKPKKKNKKKKRKTEAKTEEENKGGELENGKQIVQETDVSIDRQASGDVLTKVYVGGIPYYSTEDDIRSYLESCGTITEVDCLRFPDSGKFRGIAIISFKTEAAAKRALALDGAEMGELFLKIQPYKATRSNKLNKVSDFAPQIVEGYNKIYVGNLSWDITEDDLRKLFSDCKISSIHFGKDKETGEFRGYAHVNFSDSLSVTMALKLDQKVVCGRPVKISCAVPLKKAGTPSNPAATTSSTHSISVASAMSADSIPVDKTMGTGAGDGGFSDISGKIKRRTCYECGDKGHLSSACPKSVTTTFSTHSISVPTTTSSDPTPAATASGTGADNSGLSATSGKIKRRTCYECGEKGHLSSACPKSATTVFNTHSTPVAKTTSTKPTPVATATGADNGELSDISGKIKRRTCYECGEKGHLSSACPKAATTPSSTHSIRVATVTSTGPIPVATTTSTATTPVTTTTSTDLPPDVTAAGTGADPSGLCASSGKIKRRTCYECGEKGHISSACPKKQTNAN